MSLDSTNPAPSRNSASELQFTLSAEQRSEERAGQSLDNTSLTPARSAESRAHFEGSYQRLSEAYERQIHSAQERGDEAEANRVRGEYEVFLQGWRANEELMRTFPIDFELDQVSRFSASEKERVRAQLTATEVLSSSFPEERLMRANAQFLLGDARKALHGFDELIGLIFDQARLQRHRGLCLLELEIWDSALSAFERAIQQESTHPSALRGKGVALLGQGYAEEAIVHFGRSLELAPHQAETHFQIGEALYALDRVDEACAAYKRSSQISPDEPRYVHRYARTLVCLGQLDQAIEAFDLAFDQQAFSTDEAIEHLKRITSSSSSRNSAPQEHDADHPQRSKSRAPSSRRSHYRRRRSRRRVPLLYLGGIVLALFLSVILNDLFRTLSFRQRVDSRAATPAHSTVEDSKAPPMSPTLPVPLEPR